MKLHTNKIKDEETDFHFTEKNPWVAATVKRVNEEDAPENTCPIHFDLSVRMVDEIIVMTGRINAQVHLLCSRCASPVEEACQSAFTRLFSEDSTMCVTESKASSKQRDTATKPEGASKKKSASEVADSDLDIGLVRNHEIDLSEVLEENLRLEIGVKPLCSDSCKGICQNCGKDLNTGNCSCDSEVKMNPFTALKGFKVGR